MVRTIQLTVVETVVVDGLIDRDRKITVTRPNGSRTTYTPTNGETWLDQAEAKYRRLGHTITRSDWVRSTNELVPDQWKRTLIATKTVTNNTPDHFPEAWSAVNRTGSGEREHQETIEHTWKRTYPAGMRMDDQDHLAVASGAYDRYCETPERFTQVQGRWVENLSNVRFDDVDVAYLDYVRGTNGRVAGWVAEYANGPAASRFSDTVHSGAEDRRFVGWMYATLGTLLAYQARRDSDSELSASGFIPGTDDTPQDHWHEGLTWGHESRDWKPQPHEAGRILDQLISDYTFKGGRGMKYETIRAGREARTPIGPIKWKAMVQVTKPDGTPAFELPGKWIPDTPKHGEEHVLQPFVDRHAWDAIIWAAGSLRELYTRIVELGPNCVPESDDSDLGPVEWVRDQVNTIMENTPRFHVGFTKEVKALDQMARAVMTEANRVYTPEPEPEVELDLEYLAKALRKMFPRKPRTKRPNLRRRFRTKIVRTQAGHRLDSGEYAVIDAVSAYPVGWRA